MCEQDEAWSEARYFSESKMRELYAPERPEAPAPDAAELELFARKAIASSLELADRLEAA